MKFSKFLLPVLLFVSFPIFAAIDLAPITSAITDFSISLVAALGVAIAAIVGYMAVIWGSKALIRFVNGLLYSAV